MRIFQLTSLIAIVFTAVVFMYVVVSPPNKMGYVDSARLLAGYKPMIDARSEFEKKQAVWKSNVDTLAKEVQNAIEKYERIAATGSPKESEIAKDFITAKQKELRDYQAATRQNSGEEEQRLTQGVITTVNTFLQRYGKTHGYKIVLIAANGNMAYADPSLDITDKVVEELNRDFAGPSK